MAGQALEHQLSSSESKPIELYEFDLGEPDGTLYLAANQPDDVVFGGATYAACPIRRDPCVQTARTQEDLLVLDIGNVDQSYTAFLASRDVRRSKVTLKLVFGDLLDDSSEYHVVFLGVVDKILVQETSVRLECFSEHSFQHYSLPLRRYQKTCQWTFGDEWCGVDLEDPSITPTAKRPYLPVRLDDGVVSPDPSEASEWSFVSGSLNQNDGHWEDGQLVITQRSGCRLERPETRRVVKFTAADQRIHVDMPLTETLQPGDRFRLIRGCPKTWEACAVRTDAYYPLTEVIAETLSTEPPFSGFVHLQDAQRKPMTFRRIE